MQDEVVLLQRQLEEARAQQQGLAPGVSHLSRKAYEAGGSSFSGKEICEAGSGGYCVATGQNGLYSSPSYDLGSDRSDQTLQVGGLNT